MAHCPVDKHRDKELAKEKKKKKKAFFWWKGAHGERRERHTNSKGFFDLIPYLTVTVTLTFSV